ncbi:ScyD/ScyE family protein [Roseisolibacter sp. H3M3-2]|uniref:ScyD/ScyE family protein n=1 Tax=Roseisolibacter sp. H3M3-2 TaxID=3031323 RepID=UPI0023DCCF5A|nr:ScyD/ScyE family protein [Roseisolibacter sp. H3M3-2]MDF1503212.1 ScyD/ScyE family protein [Roseisolibacter sp. H3M3-2]
MRNRLPISIATLLALAACQDPTAAPLAPDAGAPRAARDAAPAPSRTVFMSGLDAPRGLAFAPDGALYVTESGRTTVTTNCTPLPRGLYCYSGTGAISRKRRGVQERVVSGLPSYYNANMQDITGPQHIDFQGAGNAYFTIGWGGPPTGRAGLGAAGAAFGTLARLHPNGSWSVVADVAAFEQSRNPDGEVFDSNPYGLLAEGGRQYVTDAGGNSLLEVDNRGAVSLVATFPRVPAPAMFGGSAQAVPTEVVRGPDGALYVSTLTGVPFSQGAAIIYRVSGGVAQPYATGLKTVTDLAFAPDGQLYALQYATGPVFFPTPGALLRVVPGAGPHLTVAGNLPNATALAIDGDGAFYVAVNGDRAGVDEVLRIVP